MARDERATAVEWRLVAGLVGFAGLALLGFGWFGLHPERLAQASATAVAFYGVSYRALALGQVLVSALVLVWVLVRRTGWRWLGAFCAVYALSLASELLGTGAGVPFGEYAYTAVLAPMWLGRVPAVIPLGWFLMAVPSFGLAGEVGRGGRWGRVLLGSLLLLVWDLALDPAMSHVTRYWVWGEPGVYYGMPALNLFGWYVTGLALMGVLAVLRVETWLSRLPRRWLAAFYGANLVLPVGMCAVAGLWGAVGATVAAVAGVAVGVGLTRGDAARGVGGAGVPGASGPRERAA